VKSALIAKALSGAALAAVIAIAVPAAAQYGRHHGGGGGGRGEVYGDGNRVGAEITVYSGPGFTGRRITFTSSQRDLGGYNFNDQAMSVRATGPWKICTDARYDGRCEWVNGDVPDLRRMGMAGQVSSVELVENGQGGGGGYNGGGYNGGGGGYNGGGNGGYNGGGNGNGGWNGGNGGGGGGGRLILYGGRNFRGDSYEVRGGEPNLSGAFNDRAQSARVIGVWTVCSDAQFGGRCVALRGDIADLNSMGMGRTISSAHPGY
jgi:hypothetical protein